MAQPKKSTKKPATKRGAATTNGDAAHVEAVHRAEAAVDEIEQSQARFRDKARTIMGVTGSADVPTFGQGLFPVVGLGLLVVVNQFQAFAVSILGPEISRALGVSKGLLAFLLVVRLLAAIVASLPMAAYVQRTPRRAVVAKATALVWSAATVLSAFVASAAGLFGAMLVHGLASGSVEAVHTPLVMDAYEPGTRVRALSIHRAAVAVGTVLAAVLIGVLTGAMGLTWRALLLVMGAISFGAVALSWRLRDPGFGPLDVERVREEVRRREGTQVDVDDSAPDLGFFETLRRVMAITTVRRMLAAWAAVGVMVFPFTTYVFFFLDERWNVGPGGRAGVFAGAWAVSIAALAVFGRAGDGLFLQSPAKLVRAIAVLLLAAAAGLVVTVAVPYFPVMLVGLAVVVSVVVLLAPAVNMVVLSMVPPAMRAHTSAMLGIFLTGVGGIGGVVLLGGLDRRFGISGALLCLCGPILIAAWVAYRAAPGARTWTA